MKTNPKIVILLVDDHLAVRLGLTTIINDQADMRVAAEAANGPAALEAYGKTKPDVVLLDLHLPGMDGVEVIKELHARFDKPLIVVLTTLDREEDIYRSLEAGAKGYLLKDMRKEDLIEAIRTVHGGGRWISGAASARLAQRVVHVPLTARETEILRFIVGGKTNKEIAAALSLSEDTVKWHLKSLFAKLEVNDRTQAAVIAIQRGLVQI
jgi:two-component system, NarL family, response regulator